MFYDISNWIIVAGAIICLFCMLGRHSLGSYIVFLISLVLPGALFASIVLTSVVGVIFALYLHEWKPLYYGLLWGIPLAVPVSIFRLSRS